MLSWVAAMMIAGLYLYCWEVAKDGLVHAVISRGHFPTMGHTRVSDSEKSQQGRHRIHGIPLPFAVSFPRLFYMASGRICFPKASCDSCASASCCASACAAPAACSAAASLTGVCRAAKHFHVRVVHFPELASPESWDHSPAHRHQPVVHPTCASHPLYPCWLRPAW